MNCPYCNKSIKNNAGLSAHIMGEHSDKWKGKLKDSIPETKQSTKKLMKGMKKPKIYNKCPWCSYGSDHPPGMARHIASIHPEHWKGNLGSSLGREPSRNWKKEDSYTKRIQQLRRESNARFRARNIAKGLTASGRPRKRGMPKDALARYGLSETPMRHSPRHKIEPIVYKAEPDDYTTDSSLRDAIINKVAEKIAEKLLQ